MANKKSKHKMTDNDIKRIEKSKGAGADDELPEGYQHPIGHPQGSEVLTVDDLPWGKAREQELADAQPEAIAARREKEEKAEKK